MSPLHDACRDGDTERVRQLLDEGAAVDEKDELGRTALMLAISMGHTEVVQLLLDKGAAVDLSAAEYIGATMPRGVPALGAAIPADGSGSYASIYIPFFLGRVRRGCGGERGSELIC